MHKNSKKPGDVMQNLSELPKEQRNCIIFNNWLHARSGRKKALFEALKVAPQTARQRYHRGYTTVISDYDFERLMLLIIQIEKKEKELDEKRAIQNLPRRAHVLNWVQDRAGRKAALSRELGMLPSQFYQDFKIRPHQADITDLDWQQLCYLMREIEKREAINMLLYLCVKAWAAMAEHRMKLLKDCYTGKGYVFMTRISENGKNINLIAYPQWDLVVEQMRYIEQLEYMKKAG